MADRKNLLSAISAGDIFHAVAPNRAVCIGLVLSVNGAVIEARRITTQEILAFDRTTGNEIGDKVDLFVINSVETLPTEIRDALLAMDKRFGELMAMDEEVQFSDLERWKLTETEKRALKLIRSHYASNPLPG